MNAAGRAWETYRRVRGWVDTLGQPRARWRSDLALGCGLTRVAVDAALRDVAAARGARPARVLSAPDEIDDDLRPDPDGAGVLGCTFSGGSAEVMEALAELRRRGLPGAVHGSGAASATELRIPAGLAAPPFSHLAFCATIPALVGTAVPAVPAPVSGLAAFLGEAEGASATALFVSGAGGFVARAALSYWLEYFHRPGFLLRYPDFTHDLLWALVRSGGRRFAFVLERPARDLPDRRFAQTCRLLSAQAVPVFVVPSPALEPGGHVGLLLGLTDEVHALAVRRGNDLTRELTFEGVLSAEAG